MSEPIAIQPSDNLVDLAFFALEHGMRSVGQGDGPLIPFVISQSDTNDRQLARFTSGSTPDEARQHAQQYVSTFGPEITMYAIAADGFVTLEGIRYPVVMVEAAERGQQTAFMFAQRFRPNTSPKFSETFGNPGIINRSVNLFEPKA